MLARENPFATHRVLRVRYRLSGTTWEDLETRLGALGFRAALVGPHGHGKTTLLEDLGERLAARGFEVRTVALREGDRQLGRERRRVLFQDLAPSVFLLLDGAEQLGRLAWHEARLRTKTAGGLLVTSHRSGLLPTLHECRTSPELLAGIVRSLGGDVEAAGELFERFGGDLRLALRELYDRAAVRPGPGSTLPEQ